MASDELRKKWGTIFMGEREASEAQLDAMQEPALREHRRRQQEEDYLTRVRARAEARAREILGAAYAERQKVLDEARDEAVAAARELTREAEGMQQQARAALDQAQEEQAKAAALREEAARLRDAAHGKGFQAGMDAAGEELAAFRQDLGQSLAAVLRQVEARQTALCKAWREELTELTLAAVEAGTGWLLQSEHTAVLRRLVLEAVNLLEERSTISVRVHPDDEAAVGGLFQAARERVPELHQWVVTGDPNLAPGDLVAESGSGSVDCRREYFREMVAGVLAHLTLPQRPEDTAAAAALGDLVAQEAARLAAPEAAPAADPMAAPDADGAAGAEAEPLTGTAPESGESMPESVPEPRPGMTSGPQAVPLPDAAPAAQSVAAAEAVSPAFAAEYAESSVAPSAGTAEDGTPPMPPIDFSPSDPPSDVAANVEPAPIAPSAPPPAREATAASGPDPVSEEETPLWLPPLGENASGEAAEHVAPATPAPSESVPETAHAVPAAPAAVGGAAAQSAPSQRSSGPNSSGQRAAHPADPSLAELEEELFPLDEDANARNVLAQGGFLPGADHER